MGHRTRYFLAITVLCFQAISFPVGNAVAVETNNIATTNAKLRLSYERIRLPANEHMGLLGTSMLYDVNDWLSIGPAAYGAVSGQRGGFITLGLAGDLRLPVSDYIDLNTGIFVGAGGGRGGFTIQGGGLMLRSHLGLTAKLADWAHLGGGISYVDFPNGSIHSLQPYLTYEYPFSALLTHGWPELGIDTTATPQLASSRQELSLVYRHYRIPHGVQTDTRTVQYPTIRLLGIEWQNYLDNNLFVKIESEGAMGGQSNGYMQILFGAGYRLPLISGTALKFAASVGVAGGGGVATGGGLLLDGSLGIQQTITDKLFAELDGGYVKSPGASFRAMSLAAKLGYHYATPDTDANEVPITTLAGFDQQKIRFRFVQQTYLQANPNWRQHHANLNVDNLGFQADWFVTPWLYLSGQGIAAWRGQAGGYMTGLVGGGLHLPVANSPLFVELEGLVGAAGGGGLDVAGGLVWQANANVGYHFSDAYSVLGSYGYMAAPKGNFRARVIGLSFAYQFSFFSR
ncbi:MAG TPA: hypothetical protein VNI58_02450 [Mariprofundaceae bacterium]|nr:hypothetical protein [Mariprofundaceae bacterium]